MLQNLMGEERKRKAERLLWHLLEGNRHMIQPDPDLNLDLTQSNCESLCCVKWELFHTNTSWVRNTDQVQHASLIGCQLLINCSSAYATFLSLHAERGYHARQHTTTQRPQIVPRVAPTTTPSQHGFFPICSLAANSTLSNSCGSSTTELSKVSLLSFSTN